jgi:hypothetical protein
MHPCASFSWLLGVLVAAAVAGGCGASTDLRGQRRPSTDAMVAPDIVVPVDVVSPPVDAMATCASNASCDDGVFCNGAERCVAGRCEPGTTPSCDDNVRCTTDSCDEATARCRHVPTDRVCNDDDACTGEEHCMPGALSADRLTGCVPGSPIDCQDSNICTLDLCDPTGCRHVPRDVDGDGLVDRMCGGPDCNDGDALTFPGAPEVCDDRRDNNCNGLVDRADSSACISNNDTCAQAFPITGPGLWGASTNGAFRDDYRVSCLATPSVDGVFTLVLTEPRRVTIFSNFYGPRTAIAVYEACPPAGREIACAAGVNGMGGPEAPLVRIPRLGPGTFVIVAEPERTNLEYYLNVRTGPPE